MTVDAMTSVTEDARRGRKRGKHNFEPGYVSVVSGSNSTMSFSAIDTAQRLYCMSRCSRSLPDGFPCLQKDLLCKQWADFAAANNRCPRMDEIEDFSRKSFLQRRRQLEEEDPDHPLLVILECPLDATQVKNLINNEKKKRQRARPTSTSHGRQLA